MKVFQRLRWVRVYVVALCEETLTRPSALRLRAALSLARGEGAVTVTGVRGNKAVIEQDKDTTWHA